MEKKELISVIIPVYNVEKYLIECVDSVLNQTYTNFEIILVDDGSTDESGRICDEYAAKDSKVKVIHQENKGLSEARNSGFFNATGKYVYFLDSDDWILPETLEKLLDKAERKNADMVFFDAYSFEDGRPEKEIKQNYQRKNLYKTDRGYKVFSELQKHKEYHSAVPLMFLRKIFLEENKICFEPGILYEDMIYTYEVFCRADSVAYICENFYQRRYRSNSIMTSKKTSKNFYSAKCVYSNVCKVSQKLNLSEEEGARDYIVRCAFNALNYYKALSKEEKNNCKKDYIELKSNILKDNGYGNRALKMRCYGTMPWFVYKCIEKLFITG